MRLLVAACVLLPVALFAQGGLPNQPYIYVEGKAEIEKPADLVTLHFNVVARNADQAKANAEVQGKATKILAMLDERKIPRSDVVASDLKSNPEFAEPHEQRGRIIGHKVTRTFAVVVRELPVFPKLVDELMAIVGVEFHHIQGGLVAEDQFRDELRAKALADALAHAEKAVSGAGMKIDSVFALSPVPFPDVASKMLQSGTQRVIVTGAPEYLVGPVIVSQAVHVIYLISPAK